MSMSRIKWLFRILSLAGALVLVYDVTLLSLPRFPLRKDSSQYAATQHRNITRPSSINCSLDSLRDDIGTFRTEHKMNYSQHQCIQPPQYTKAEDILCLRPFDFNSSFKNPCLYTVTPGHRGTLSSLKCLPYFHIFGVCKSGTTDLYHRLTKHPQFVQNHGVLGKETWFWSWKRYGRGVWNGRKMTIGQFSDMFNASFMQNSMTTSHEKVSVYITGHADPMDFWDHTSWRQIPQNDALADVPTYLTPHLIHHILPNIKLILLLREPSERLYSHYYHDGIGNSPEDFHRDIVFALDIYNRCVSLYSIRKCIYGKQIMDDINIPISASLYYVHLHEWLEVFPRKQLFIARTEDYSRNTADTLQDIFRFLDVEPMTTKQLTNIARLPNQYPSRKKQSRGPMYTETRKLLTAFFAPYNCRLAAILNDDRYLWKDVVYYNGSSYSPGSSWKYTKHQKLIRKKWVKEAMRSKERKKV